MLNVLSDRDLLEQGAQHGGTENCVTSIFCETRDKNHPNTHNRKHGMGETENCVTVIFCETRDKNHPNTHNREHGIRGTENCVIAIFCETRDKNHPNTQQGAQHEGN